MHSVEKLFSSFKQPRCWDISRSVSENYEAIFTDQILKITHDPTHARRERQGCREARNVESRSRDINDLRDLLGA